MPISNAAYDPIADEYAQFAADHDDPTTVGGIATKYLLAAVNRFIDSLNGPTICDLGCGEGHLSRRLATESAQVVGIDISERLLDIAKSCTDAANVSYVLDDAQVLASMSDGAFDAVVSNLALMDIPDLNAVISTVKRVLKPDGFFIFSITHPCFQAPTAQILCDEAGVAIGRRISQYVVEGFWRSESPSGLRGKVGAYHRTLSTYINTLLSNGFVLRYVDEPTLPAANYDLIGQQIQIQIPSVMIVVVQLFPQPA